jgi:hypothetical protein
MTSPILQEIGRQAPIRSRGSSAPGNPTGDPLRAGTWPR